ncbi:phosphatidate cytidylyltransferase [Sphingomonas hylomeconis]|uniref:Phosphatidate cytidylyltransferase n=1 Tax=Sphingomonas hylomeconis TaxID=1395958 RepID=A0ABV7SVH9_9SPHN|nr:phosphatidate cytidylyltransferase [Sphingomonas hylomeconis]
MTAAKRKSDLAVRAGTGVLLIAVAAVALWLGGIAFWVLCTVGALFMMAEWADLAATGARADARNKRVAQFALSVPLATMAPASLIIEVHYFFTLGLLAGAAFFTVIVTRQPRLASGIVYCGLPVLSLVFLRRADHGLLFAFWTLALVWACDIGAYFSGRSIGGPKLAPAISPNKTWAGLAGGVVAAGLFAMLLHVQFGLPWRMTLATPVLAVVAQGGDLYESWLKRRAGVKDSGNILPGHGGVLDRLDGLVPIAPLAALLLILPRFYA